MKKNLFKKLIAGIILTGLVATATACGSSKTTNTTENKTATDETTADTSAGEVKKIIFAYRNTGNWPVTGDDEKGNPTGYDIEVLREVDKLLEDYEFEFVGTSYDDAYIGLEAGNYDAALTNAFWTEARAEKYLISEQNLGASVLILVKTAENANIKNLEDLSKAGLELAPILAGNGMYYVVQQYNQEHPDDQVTITPTDDSTYVAGSVEEVVAGKYDAAIYTKPAFETNVVGEDGDLHSYVDKISYSEFSLAKTYPMFSKSVGEEFLALYNDALVQVIESGKASEISLEFYGYDIFNYEFN